MDAVDRERLGGGGEKLLRGSEEVHELDAVSLGDFSHGSGIEAEVLIIIGDDVGVEVRRLEVFVREGGEEHDAGLALAEIGGERDFQEFIEGDLEVRQAGFAFEVFIEAPVSEHHVGVEVGAGVVGDAGLADHLGLVARHHVEEVVEGRDFVRAVRLEGGLVAGEAEVRVDFVTREAEVADHELLLGEALVDQGLEVAVVLLTVGKTAADDGDVIAILQLKGLGGGRRDGSQGQQEGEQLAHSSVVW